MGLLSFGGGRSSTRPENQGLDDRARKDIERENDHKSFASGRSWIMAKAHAAQNGGRYDRGKR